MQLHDFMQTNSNERQKGLQDVEAGEGKKKRKGSSMQANRPKEAGRKSKVQRKARSRSTKQRGKITGRSKDHSHEHSRSDARAIGTTLWFGILPTFTRCVLVTQNLALRDTFYVYYSKISKILYFLLHHNYFLQL